MARKDWIEKLTPGHFEHGEEFDREGNEVLPCQYDTYELAFQANIPPATVSTPAQTPPAQTRRYDDENRQHRSNSQHVRFRGCGFGREYCLSPSYHSRRGTCRYKVHRERRHRNGAVCHTRRTGSEPEDRRYSDRNDLRWRKHLCLFDVCPTEIRTERRRADHSQNAITR